MNKLHYVNLATFNVWGNKKICDFIAAKLSAENIDREIVSSFPSIKKTLYHIWDAEMIWHERLRGNALTYFPSENFTGSFEEGSRKFMENSTSLVKMLSAKDEKYFEGSITFTKRGGEMHTHEVTAVLTHVMNHSSFHRGQLITMFRQLGFSSGIPETDFIEYYREKRNQ